MFSTPPWMASAPPAPANSFSADHSSSGSFSRSRSPTISQRHFNDQNGTSNTKQYPVTGSKISEDWFRQHVLDAEVVEMFMEVPQRRRKSVILKCIQNPPENVHSWLFAVVRNHRNAELEKQLLAQASVHKSGQPGRTPTASISSTQSDASVDLRGNDTVRATPVQSPTGLARLASGARQSADVPSWSSDMIALWPDSKSQLVARFMALLSPTNQGAVASLVPQTQACVALAVALLAQDNHAADSLTAEFVRRLQQPDLTRRCATSDASSTSRPSSCHQLQLVFASPETAVALVFTTCLIRAMEKMYPGAFNYLPLIVVSSQISPTLTAEAEKLKLSLNDAVTCPATLENYFESSKSTFKQYNVKTFFVSLIPADTDCGGRTSMQRGKPRLHGEGLRFLWSVVKCSHFLRAAVGDDAVCELTFAPSSMDDAMKVELAQVTGPLTSTSHASYNTVAPVPVVFATPSGCGVVAGFRSSDHDTSTAIDGWQVSKDPQVSEEVSGGLITFIVKTSEITVFQGRPLSPLEQKTIEDFTMTHVNTGERRLCSREWWFRWYGYVKTPLQATLHSQYPCHSMIFSATGSQAAPGVPGGEPCGKRRYCIACEKVFLILDKTYCLPIMVDAAVALLAKSLLLWNEAGDPAAWKRNPGVSRTHECGPSCPLAV